MESLLRELHDGVAERPPLALPAGVELAGHYRIGRVLGRPGGFGLTYLALDTVLERLVAIKEFLPRELVSRSESSPLVAAHGEEERRSFEYGRRRFVDEGRLLATIDHPAVVRVVELFEAHGTAYLVMEYQRGAGLDEALAAAGGRLETALATAIAGEMLAGLEATHVAGVLHCDVKPANVYLSLAGGVVLLDFGAARRSLSERSASVAQVATPGYAPLELLQENGRPGPWTDVYSAAATLFQMLRGERPPHVTDRLADDPLAAEGGPLAGLPSDLTAALRAALALGPAERTASARAFARALAPWALPGGDRRQRVAELAGAVRGRTESVAGGSPTETLDGAAARPPVVFRRRRARRWVGGAIAAALLFAALAIPLLRRVELRSAPKPAEPPVARPPAAAATPLVAEVATRPAPGRVVLVAAPWAEILSIESADGRPVAELAGRAAPIAFELAPGRYRIRLRRPGSGATEAHEVAVGGGRETRLELVPEPVDAGRYFTESGW